MPPSDSFHGRAAEGPPDILNIEEVADYLRIPRSSIYKLAKRRGIPSQKVGRQWRFSKQAIDAWLASLDGADVGAPVQSSRLDTQGSHRT